MPRVPQITINNPNRIIDINVPNTGGGSGIGGGNPFVNWTPPTGNFGGNSGGGLSAPSGIPTFNPPGMNIPNSIPNIITQGGGTNFTPQPQSISVEESKSNGSSGNYLNYSNRNLSVQDIKSIPVQEGCYQLVSFKNNNIGCEGLQHLIYSEEGQTALTKGSSDLKEIYQGMLAKQGVMIVKLDLSSCNIGGLSSDKLGQAIYNGSLNSLQHLNLSNNNITDDGIYAFGNAWFCNTSPSLRTLNLSNNKLTDNGASSLSWSLKKGNLYYLYNLDISGNSEITDVGKAKLVTAAKESLNQNLSIILEKQSSLEGVKSFMKKAFSYYAGEIKKFLDERQTTSEEVSKAALKVYGTDDWAHCKKFLAEGGFAAGQLHEIYNHQITLS